MSVWQHYRALIYKNWILWKRRLCGSCCELLFPIFLLIVLALIRQAIGFTKHDARSYLYSNAMAVSYNGVNNFEAYFKPTIDFPDNAKNFSDNYYRKYYHKDPQKWYIAFVNEYNNTFNDGIISDLKSRISQDPSFPYNFMDMSSENALEDYIKGSSYDEEASHKIVFAVVFYNQDSTNIEYSFRFNVTESYPSGSRNFGDNIEIFDFTANSASNSLTREPMPVYQNHYFATNFIHIMNYIDNIILVKSSTRSNPYISAGFVPMYYDDYVHDDFIQLIANTLPFFLVISYIVPVCRMISLIVQEKEYKIKEMMMIMGLSNRAYWLSWVTYYFSVYLAIAIIGAIISTQLFKYSNIGIMFISFLLYGISCLCFSIFISMFFSKSRSAVMLGLMIFLISYFINFAVSSDTTSRSSKTAASLLPNVALGLGALTLAVLEEGQAGVQPDNTSTVVNNYTYGTFLGFMVLDSILFIIFAVYLDQVWPTEWGVKRPWYFIVTKQFWCPRKVKEHDGLFDDDVKWGESVEAVSADLEKQKETGQAMMVRGFKKDFDNKTAVDGLDLDIYEGQIFALLGHNGAGKTTTISMMCGLIAPTHGDMKVNNLHLSTDLTKLRRSLGVCPQHNVLFEDLTPTEHLYIFSVFKGMKDQKLIKQKIAEKLTEVDLVDKKDKKVKFLSGGMKRKLSLALALIADSPIVMLDEPTSGMDLTARRQMWDMLKNNKNGRIIILTTHYMEEADVLADRIAIMSHGKLRCLGSSLFLKKKYGVGYYLTIVKEMGIASTKHTKRIKDFIQGHIPEANMMSDVHAEIAFQLPTSSTKMFTEFFTDLDNSLENLQLRSYGVSVTTLEEVFLRVARGDEGDIKNKDDEKEEDEITLENGFVLSRDRLKGSLFMNHFWALLKKRVYWSKRDYRSLIYEIFIPIILVIVGLGLMMLPTPFETPGKHKLTVNSYSQPQDTLYSWKQGSIINGPFSAYNDTDTSSNGTIEAFDDYIFQQRAEPDHFRMGSYYFNKMDTTTDQYEPVIFHNQSAFQATGAYYNKISNAILGNLDPPISVTVYNYPFPYTKRFLSLSQTGDGFISSIIFSLGYSFIPAGIIALIVKERENNVKHQHMISGVSLFSYWTANFVWDAVKHLIPAIVCALLVLAFNVDVLVNPTSSYGACWLLMLLYGVSIAPFTYFTSFFFKSYPNAQVITILFNFVVGGIFPAVILVMYLFESSRPAAKALRWIFRLFPSFCFGNGIMDIGSNSLFSSLDGRTSDYDIFSMNSAGADILLMGITIPFYLLIIYIEEYLETHPKILERIFKSPAVAQCPYEHDEDVELEAQHAMDTDPSDVQVNVRGLRKVFRIGITEAFTAVEDVSFNVSQQECFALLGVNGAGKTTTFKMLTGEIAPTDGEAYICGYNVIKELERARDLIGYCPQFDAISELLTAREHLNLYSDIKGIPKENIKFLVDQMLQQMDLLEYADLLAGTYSGGNKRKLSVAMALIGNPTVVFLDEPSAGMDPETRKKMWKVIGNIKKRNSSVILTTHSMEEAEALSDRMAIMVAGRLRCLGSATWIKSKYGDRYEFEVKVEMPSNEEIANRNAKLDHILGNHTHVRADQVNVCLELLDASNLIEEIHDRGAGSSLHQQFKTEGAIPRETVVSWAIVEKLGDNIFEWLKSEFKVVEIVEHFSSLYKFKIGKEADKSLGYFFSAVEINREKLKISEYALSQSSLEQIFNDFAKKGDMEQAGLVRRYKE